MNISKQLGWMIGLGVLSFTLVGVGTANTPRDAHAEGDQAPVCRPAPASPRWEGRRQPMESASEVPHGVGTGGAAGSGPPLDAARVAPTFSVAAASAKAPTTELVFFPLWARQ